MTFDFITTEKFTAVEAFAFRQPPTWTRLEPQSRSGDPRPGIEARVHDPLWLLGRQWQLGEFEGEDAGTPLTVRVVTRTTPIDRWAPGAEAGGLAIGPHDLLEPYVEAETMVDPSGPGLRPRAEAGSALLAALSDLTADGLTGVAAYRSALVAACPLDLDPADHPGGAYADRDPAWVRLTRLLGSRPIPDGELACASIEAAGGGLPGWLVPVGGDDPAVVLAAITAWATWYRAEVSPLGPLGGARGDAWAGDRLEYRFRVGAGDAVFEAPAHGGGEIGWTTFDAVPGGVLDPPGEPPVPDGPAPDGPAPAGDPRDVREVHALLASPLRYPGMPADRLWEMEDAQVNLGLVEAEPWDLARLLLAEFALTYGNDWLVVPVDVPYGTLTDVESVLYVTTFGERYVVRPTSETSPDGRWRMFAVTAADGSPVPGVDGLLIPPGAVAVQDGPAVEEVLFLRDEMANLAWAVERSVTGPSGASRDRSREPEDRSALADGPVAAAELDYRLSTTVPARWIPFLPRSSGYRAIELMRGAMPDAAGLPVLPLGQILATPGSAIIKDAEIPREGVLVRRRPSSTRRADGSYVRWTTRRVNVGRGEGASQLGFDWARPRRPHPNEAPPA